MPTYDFICTKCGKKEERMCRIAERTNQKCKCGAEEPMKQGISVPAIHGMDSQGSSGGKNVHHEDFDFDSVI